MFYPAGSWGDDGYIIAALNVAVGLSRVPAAGGPPALLKLKPEHAEVYRWPQVLPGNQAVLFTASRGDYESGNIDVFPLKTGQRKTVQQGGIVGSWPFGTSSPEAPYGRPRSKADAMVFGSERLSCFRRQFWIHLSLPALQRRSRRMGNGWRLHLLNPARLRFTVVRFQDREGNGEFLQPAEHILFLPGTAASCLIWIAIQKGSWS